MTTELLIDENMSKKIIQWACQYLTSHGYTLESNLPENVQITPWSYVVRFATSESYIYLKHTPDLLALEASIIQILHDQLNVSVPKIIAHNVELNCFLMKDAGRPLREHLKQQFDTALFCRAIYQFTSMQLIVANHLDIFFDIGVPDWRLDKLPGLYRQLLLQKEVLIADGLTKQEISKLEKLIPKVRNLCQRLSSYAIKPSLVQPDFNDNNTLIADVSRDITIIDLGEIVISHPFFSLINCLQQAKKHHALTDKDDRYRQLIDACLKNYKIFTSKKHLLEAFELARILFFIYAALGNYRLRVACDKGKLSISSFQGHGRPSIPLKELMTASIAETALNELSDEINKLYGYVKIAGDNFGEPAINSGPCGPFANAFFKQWNLKFTEKVNIVFIMVKNSDECWHVLIRLPNGLLYDGGHGIHDEDMYSDKFDIEDMIEYDINLLEKRSHGLDREYPRYCPSFSINTIKELIEKYLNRIPKNITIEYKDNASKT